MRRLFPMNAIPLFPAWHMTFAPVAALLSDCGPAAILWRVRAIVVDAIDGVFRGWTWPHIGQKRCELVAPSVAHGDAASAPVLVSGVGQIEASAAEVAPCLVFNRRAATPLVPVLCGATDGRFRSQAPTAHGLSVTEMRAVYIHDLTAVTAARPVVLTTTFRALSQDTPTRKALPSEID